MEIVVESLDNLSCRGKAVNVICFTEHNMIKSDVDLLKIPNYNLVTSFTRHKRNGGSCDILNDCIEQGKFPNKLKISIIKPLYKKGEKTEVGNYRPVALIPIFAKIFEKLIYNRLNK